MQTAIGSLRKNMLLVNKGIVMENIIIIAIVLGLVVAVSAYIIKAKKSGKKCIGCPDSSSCNGSCATCSCACKEKDK